MKIEMFTPVFVYVSSQMMPGMRQSTDLIVPFASVCLQNCAGEREMHAPNTNTSTYTVKSRLIFNYLKKYSFKSWKIYIPGSHLAQLGGVTSDSVIPP